MTRAEREHPVIVVGQSMAGTQIDGCRILSFDQFRGSLIEVDNGKLALADLTVVGICLTEAEKTAIMADQALADLISAAQLPLQSVSGDPEDLLREIIALLARRLASVAADAHDERAAAALLRRQHSEMQSDFQDLEGWIYEIGAPKYRLVRSWAATEATLDLPSGESVTQPMPVPARGLVWIDVHLPSPPAGPGTLEMRLTRPAGPDFADPISIDIDHGSSGWVRAAFPTAPGGPPEDANAVMTWRAKDGRNLALSLAPDSPFEDLNAHHAGAVLGAPLAIKIHQTVPRLSPPPVHDPRFGLPSDGVTRLVLPAALGQPQALPYLPGTGAKPLKSYPDRPDTWPLPKNSAFGVKPSARRPVVLRFSGVKAAGLFQARVVAHVPKADAGEVAVAVGIVPKDGVASAKKALSHVGQWIHVLPGDWGEAWCDLAAPIDGEADILVAVALPDVPFNDNSHVQIRAFRVTSRATD